MPCPCTDRNREVKIYERGIEVTYWCNGMYVCKCACICMFVHVRTRVCMHVIICMYVCMCCRRRYVYYGILFPILQVCVLYVCMYMYLIAVVVCKTVAHICHSVMPAPAATVPLNSAPLLTSRIYTVFHAMAGGMETRPTVSDVSAQGPGMWCILCVV